MTGFLVPGKQSERKGREVFWSYLMFSLIVFSKQHRVSVRTSESDGSVGFFLSFFFVSSREDYEE